MIFISCNNPVKIKETSYGNIVLCNVDKINDEKYLKISEIAESFEMVVLDKPDGISFIIDNITVSKNYIVVVCKNREVYLYSRAGKYLKCLNISNFNKKYQAITTQVDPKEENIWIAISGLEKLLCYNIAKSKITIFNWKYKYTYDAFVLNDNRVLGLNNSDKRYWGYSQSLSGPSISFINSRYIPLYKKRLRYGLVTGDNNLLFDMYRLNDTTYLYNHVDNLLIPEIFCYSREQMNSRTNYGEEQINNRLLINADNKYLFKMWKSNRERKRYYIVDKEQKSAFYVKSIINDFAGNQVIDKRKIFSSYYSHISTDGFLTIYYSGDEFSKLIENSDNRLMYRDKLENNSYVLLLFKLKCSS